MSADFTIPWGTDFVPHRWIAVRSRLQVIDVQYVITAWPGVLAGLAMGGIVPAIPGQRRDR